MIANQALEEAFANIDKINEGTFKVRNLKMLANFDLKLGFHFDHAVAERQPHIMEL
jgi:hypothetical protein